MASRTIKHSLKVVFFCMTALPFFVFAFVYFRIGAFNTALSGALIALALILMLQGFIVFRKMAEHIEILSATMSEAEQGKMQRIDNASETKELAMIADTFNRTLSKLEETTRELSVKTIQNSKLYQDLLQSKKELEIALDDRKRAQDQLLASARMAAFGELSVSIANELNNPLTGILGYANLLLASSGITDKDSREYLEMIQSQAERAARITKNLLDIVSDKPGARVGSDINELLKKSLTLSQSRMSDSGINVSLRLGDNLPFIKVDQAQMEHVFLNLLSNAANALTGLYGNSMGTVTERHIKNGIKPFVLIKTGYVKGKVYISFRDNGPGIAPGDLPRIFEPFYSTQDKVSQVGLGLWISQSIVKAHGGTIQVKNLQGKGSLFVVVLPTEN